MASQWNLPFAVARMLAVVSIVAGLCLRASGAACADPNNASQSARIGGHFSTPIDRLCFPTEIFVAEILRTSLTDCRLKYPTVPICDPKDELTLRIRVDETLAANEQELARLHVRVAQPNDCVDVVTKLYNSRPTDIGGQFPPKDEFDTLKVDPPTGARPSDQQISDLFIGQRFIFGIRPHPFDKARPPSATVWTMKLRQWVEDILRNSAGTCPRLVRQDNPP